MRSAALLAATVAGLAVLALAGCGGSGRTSCPAGGDTVPVRHETPGGTRYLSGVVVARTDCADRVEFRFERGAPGYRVGYEDAAAAQTEDASGRHIRVAGRAFLVVRLSSAATARSDGSTLTFTYHGPRRVPGGSARHVQEAVKTGDFEAVVTWAIGLDGRRPFSVSRRGGTIAVEIG